MRPPATECSRVNHTNAYGYLPSPACWQWEPEHNSNSAQRGVQAGQTLHGYLIYDKVLPQLGLITTVEIEETPIRRQSTGLVQWLRPSALFFFIRRFTCVVFSGKGNRLVQPDPVNRRDWRSVATEGCVPEKGGSESSFLCGARVLRLWPNFALFKCRIFMRGVNFY